MADVNFYSLFSLMTILYSLVIFFYILYLQFKEVYGRQEDKLTKLRRRILWLFVIAIVATFPSIVYQVARALGYDNQSLRNFVSITGGFFRTAISHLMLIIWTYRIDDKDK